MPAKPGLSPPPRPRHNGLMPSGDSSIETAQAALEKTARQSLPAFTRVLQDGRALAGTIELGRSRFLRAHGFHSELDYKRACMRDGRIMYHAHIGLNDVSATAQALGTLDQMLNEGGFRMDRADAASGSGDTPRPSAAGRAATPCRHCINGS